MSGGRRATGRFVRLLAWCTIAVVGLVAITQALGWSPTPAAATVQSLTPYLGLGLLPVALYSWWRSDRIMTTVTIAVGAGLLILATPLALPADRPEVDPEAAGLRVASINLLDRNDRVDEVAELLLDFRPDVVVFTEYTVDHRSALEGSELVSDYPHRVDRGALEGDGIAVWSRTSITIGRSRPTAGPALDLVVDGPDGPVRMLAVHVPSPIRSFGEWRHDLGAVERFASGADGASMVIGDMNAAYWHPPFRDVLDAGLTDAHTALGAGFSASWPTGRLLPPFVRLDHALVTEGLVPTAVEDFEVPGSDHLGFVVTVVPARRAAP